MKQHTRPSGPTPPLWVTFLPGLGGTMRYLATRGHAIGNLTGGLAFAATGAGQAALAPCSPPPCSYWRDGARAPAPPSRSLQPGP